MSFQRVSHLIGCLLLLLGLLPVTVKAAGSDSRFAIDRDWFIRSGAEVKEGGEVLSKSNFHPSGWYQAKVPATVLAALVNDKVYADPYFGENLRAISGTTYPIGANFSNIPMPPGSPFRSAWWYRTHFVTPPSYAGKHIQLHFDGINFRANVWLNGKLIADSRRVAGAWRLYEFDVTDVASAGEESDLAVEVFPPTPEDLAITFVDWNPAPADKGMGIWRDVYLTASGPVSVRFPQVVTTLRFPSAQLTVRAELQNWTTQPVRGVLQGKIDSISFAKEVEIAPGDLARVVEFDPSQFAQLTLKHPELWWPAELGSQKLYSLQLQFVSDGAVSDAAAIRFGVREITSELDGPEHHRLFRINGKKILIRGAGYSFDLLLRESAERNEQDLQYVRDMNLNTVRLEGKLVDDDFLERADEYGILITAGWCCCDHWEQWKRWDDEDSTVAAASLRDQIRRLRSHAAVFNWMNGSDNPPPPEVERMYLSVLKDANWPNPVQSSATERSTSVSGQSGVKMSGPYDYVTPNYWLLDRTHGGASGFNTETSPGAAVPPIDSLRSMLPEEHLWPVDSWWNYHAGGGVFRTIDTFAQALTKRYGNATNVEDFAMTSQVMQYEAERAMFEAYGRNKYEATGVIQWMLNNAWPSVIWHLYDYYLRPGGGYFGTKKACERIHVQYSYDDRSVVVVNSYYRDVPNLKVSAEVYNVDLTRRFAKAMDTSVTSDGVQKVFTIPELPDLSSTYFVRLELQDSAGHLLSSNFYWLSTVQDEPDWDKSTWWYTPTKHFANLTSLRALPKTRVNVASTTQANGEQEVTTVTVKNSTNQLAFFVHLKLSRATEPAGEEGPEELAEVLPVLWDDNYFSLMPGEERTVRARYRGAKEPSGSPTVTVDGWNVVPGAATASEGQGSGR